LGDEPHPKKTISELQQEPLTPVANATELEAYMDRNEARFFALFPDPQHVERARWATFRIYIDRVKSGKISGFAPETPNPRATQAIVGFRRTIGEEPHPRHTVRRRQQLTLAAASSLAPAGEAAHCFGR
jgi:2-polyprenyl-6-methoxyphenol hydroxylase-like FAD-dependent oxidoreductase